MKLGKMKSQRSCAVLGVPWSLPTGHRTLLRPGARWQDFPPSSFSVCQALDPCRRTALATGLPSLRASTLEAPGSITHSQSAALSKACSRPPAAKCNVSPLTPTPAAQPAGHPTRRLSWPSCIWLHPAPAAVLSPVGESGTFPSPLRGHPPLAFPGEGSLCLCVESRGCLCGPVRAGARGKSI